MITNNKKMSQQIKRESAIPFADEQRTDLVFQDGVDNSTAVSHKNQVQRAWLVIFSVYFIPIEVFRASVKQEK